LNASIDKFSDNVLEEAIALTLKQNVITRFRNKAIKYYKQQRDFLISLLEKHLSDFCQYQKPEGGMAIWIEFNNNIPLDQLVLKCKKRGLLLPDRNKLYTYPASSNGIRIGYGSIGKSDMSKAVIIIRAVIDDIIGLK